jgi:uncharacterized protein (DUF849 family)
MAKSNGELIEVAARMTRDMGRRPATVDEARKILQLDSIKPQPAQPVSPQASA